MDILGYLDPGSVSAALAAVLAGIAGIGAAFRTFGSSLKDKLFFWKKSEPATEAAGESAPDVAATSATTAASDAPEDKTPEK